VKEIDLMEVPHKRFRIEGTGASAGSHIDVAVTPDMKGSCLHVFDGGEKVAASMNFSVEKGRLFPIGLCADCVKVSGANQN
jgi:hypothetical protein